MPKTGQWAIWWLDERSPLGPVGPPVVGRFENRTGTFFSDDVVDGMERNPDSLHLGERRADLRSVGAGDLEGFGADLGDELDHGSAQRSR